MFFRADELKADKETRRKEVWHSDLTCSHKYPLYLHCIMFVALNASNLN